MITPASVREGLQVAFAIITLFFLFVCFLIYYGRKSFDKKAVLRKAPLRAIFVGFVVVLYVAEICLVALRGGPVAQNEIRFVSCILAALAWVAVSFRRSFLVVETVGLSIITLVFGTPLLVIEAVYQKSLAPVPAHHYALLGVQAARLLLLVGLLLDSSCRLCVRRKKPDESAEARPFLRSSNGDAAASHVSYGTQSERSDAGSDASSCHRDSDSDWTSDSGSADDDDEDGEQKDSEASRLRKSGSWIVYVRKFKIFVPYLIPKKDHKVQACVVICLISMIGDRFLNIIVPRQIGIITDKIVAGEAPYAELVLYLILSLAQGDSGLQLIQALAKIPVEQFSYRQITNAAFNHVMNLGMDFHSDRDSAEVMKAIEQGEALTNVVKTAVLEIMPTIFDMIVAFVFLYIKLSRRPGTLTTAAV
ncbi:hypothetical protein G6O67_008575 [Ophiocordyceps sinensis]|uniref:ABC transmembrane type-1 domain-containing protein n=1 Tax=Ophiocordyceps sinensis TaxID=72228 RepID=A0A8H4PF88_9HYPO|nr:hypothetical protein G6O67_008575 [Ophiocordyceps sinensis]